MTMLSINTNVGALKAAQASYSVNKSMETSMNRLSTGKRINSAQDDAAGLAIANRLNAEIRGINQSIKNAADAHAMLATAEGALVEVNSILLRMREIAVQSANETVDNADRKNLQSEVTQLETEIQRIVDDTTWAGITLLAGTKFSTGATFQIGPRNSDGTSMSISAIEPLSTIAKGGLNLNSHVTVQATAAAYIADIDKAISIINQDRASYGAFMNRLDHAVSSLQNTATNLAVSKGRIMDADFAAESSNLARTQVLQQASMAMLAQANASKQNILTLFQ